VPATRRLARGGRPGQARAYFDEDYWGRPLPGFGDPAAAIVVLGLAPAAHGGNRTVGSSPATAPAMAVRGALAGGPRETSPTSVARDDGLALERCWVTAAVRCAPPANRPTPEERDNCAGWLRSEL